MSFEISFTDALILMPKFASTLKDLIGNQEKLSEMARTTMNEHCSMVILNKLPRKLGDPGKFLIPCEFSKMDECLALVDLGASINLMPLSVWEGLSLLELTPTCMTLELANLSISKPIGIAKDVSFKVGVFHFPTDFVVVDFEPDPRVPLILGRCFLKTSRALIDVHKGELTLRIRNEAITYNLDQTVRYSANYNQMTANKIDVVESACEEYSQELNEATQKDHFSLPFMDQMLERLARNEYYCFLDGFFGYFQIPIVPRDQEKTTFTCLYGTFAYRRMPFGLCNAPSTFQRCMLAIFHDMVEKTMEVFMDDFSVFGNSFENCLSRLDKMLQRCEDTNLSLNWEKSHFMVKEGIVLGHKISKNEIEVDRAKVDVIAKLAHPTTVKGTSSSTLAISSDVAELKDMVKALLLDKKNQSLAPTPSTTPTPVKAVEPNCNNQNNFNRGNNFNQNRGGNFNQSNFNTSSFNQGQLNRPQVNQALVYQAPIPQTQRVSQTDFESYVKANDAILRNMKSQGQSTQNHCQNIQNQYQNLQIQMATLTDMMSKFVSANTASSSGSGTLSVWEGLSLPELTPTCMTLKLADRSVSKPIGIAKDVSFKVGVFHFPADFVVVDFEPDPSLILGRCFLKTSRALIDVHKGELTLHIRNEAITYNLDQTVRYFANYNQITANKIDVIESACEEYSQEVLGFSNVTASGTPTPQNDPIFFATSPTLTPFGDSDFLLFEEGMLFLVELKDLPHHLEYAFLEGGNKLPLIIAKQLRSEEKAALIQVLKSHKRAIAWKFPWVSPVHCVPKKGSFTVVENEENELIPTRLVTEWRVCIDYHKLNEATRKDHFPFPFMDQMLERLAGNEYYCFLDGFSGYFQILIDPRDQEKTTFTCPYGMLSYRRMPFGLCNTPGTFQRCMLAIFHDMVEKRMEVFMDDFSVFGNSFENCLSRLEKMLQRCEDTHLSLNWEKSHFMVKEGIVLGHKISKNGIEADIAKVDVIAKLPHPTTVKDCIQAFQTLKKKHTEAPILIAPNWDLPFELMCDTSDFAIGAVLGQRHEKHFKPIHYASKTMNDAETNYTTTKKRCWQ
nr:reverse transcriptase domain-containing protein [Tanacetum cinerariifolium]